MTNRTVRLMLVVAWTFVGMEYGIDLALAEGDKANSSQLNAANLPAVGTVWKGKMNGIDASMSIIKRENKNVSFKITTVNGIIWEFDCILQTVMSFKIDATRRIKAADGVKRPAPLGRVTGDGSIAAEKLSFRYVWENFPGGPLEHKFEGTLEGTKPERPPAGQANSTQKNNAAQPKLFPIPKDVIKAEQSSTFQPLKFPPTPPGTTIARVQEAKELLAEFKSAQVALVDKQLAALDVWLNAPKIGKATAKGKAPPVIQFKDRFRKDGFLPAAAKDFPGLARLKETASASFLEVPQKRLRLAYSDLIRECRARNQLEDASNFEKEATECLATAGYEVKGTVETIEELAFVDFEMASNWVIRQRLLSNGLVLDATREREWVVARVGEGLSLPAESPSAPLWSRLAIVHPRLKYWESKASPYGEFLLKAHSSTDAILDVLIAGVATVASESLRDGIYNSQGEMIDTVASRESDQALKVAQRAMGRAQSRADQYIAATKLHDELWKRFELVGLEIRNCREEYLRRRADQLAIPMTNDSVSVTRSSRGITLENLTEDRLENVEVFYTSSALAETHVPRSLLEKRDVKKASKGRAVILYSSEPELAARDIIRLQAPIRGNTRISVAPKSRQELVKATKIDLLSSTRMESFGKNWTVELSKEVLEHRSVTVWILSDSFQSEVVLSPK